MFLHLGQDRVVRTQDVVGIFDLDNTTVGKGTRGFLARAQKEDRVVSVTNELPKAFVVCGKKKGDCKVFLSQISSATLRKRAGYIDNIAGR